MFGQDNTQQPQAPITGADALTAALPDPIDTSVTATPPQGFSMSTPSLPTSDATPSSTPGLGAPSLPITDSPILDTPPEPASEPTASVAATPTSVVVSDDLLTIKQQALEHLSPLVSHLDQTPEEKFRTTMMMIQASDNKDLIKEAFEAAQAISDEKARAQALLDVINEINYFTQHQNDSLNQ